MASGIGAAVANAEGVEAIAIEDFEELLLITTGSLPALLVFPEGLKQRGDFIAKHQQRQAVAFMRG